MGGKLLRASLALGLTLGLCVFIGSDSTLAAPQTPKAGPIQVLLAAAGNPVVPPGGTVAGKGYGYWLARSLQIAYATSPGAPPSCTVVSVGGQRVALLTAGNSGISGAITCSEPAGRALYWGGAGGEVLDSEGRSRRLRYDIR